MAPNRLFYEVLLVALVLICLRLHVWWPDDLHVTSQAPRQLDQPRRKRCKEPPPFPGRIHKPRCAACAQGADIRPQAPGSPPPFIRFTRGRQRTGDTRSHGGPAPDCASQGGLGRGHIRANGPPGGQPWRQWQCVACPGYFSATHGTMFHGKRSSPERIVRVLACRAAGLGLRGTARVFESAPNTVLQWVVEAAEPLHAVSAALLHELHRTPVHLAALYAVLSAVGRVPLPCG
jgi:hypothetical protein